MRDGESQERGQDADDRAGRALRHRGARRVRRGHGDDRGTPRVGGDVAPAARPHRGAARAHGRRRARRPGALAELAGPAGRAGPRDGRLARPAVNDLLAATIEAHPTRFAGFAALPLQDPQAAAKELERSVTQLGLRGALVNAHTQGRYLDDPELRVVWEYAAGLDVPLYLHPANGVDAADVLSGHPELIGPMWSWGTDTASHALRLIFSGVFDDFPEAKLLLGHMGEALPFVLWRLDSRWDFHAHHGIELPAGVPRSTCGTTSTSRPAASAPPRRCSARCSRWGPTTSSSAPTTPSRRWTSPPSSCAPPRSARPTAPRSRTATPSGCCACEHRSHGRGARELRVHPRRSVCARSSSASSCTSTSFVRDIEPTVAEWEAAIGFLTDVGRDVRRHPPGVHPALRRAGRVDAGGDAQRRPARHREHRARPLPHDRRPRRASSATTSTCSAAAGALRGHRPGARPVRRHPAARRRARRLAVHRGRLLRRAAARRAAAGQRARAVHARTTRAASGSAPSSPAHYPIPTDGPVGALLGATGGTPTGPHMCTSSSGAGAIGR